MKIISTKVFNILYSAWKIFILVFIHHAELEPQEKSKSRHSTETVMFIHIFALLLESCI